MRDGPPLRDLSEYLVKARPPVVDRIEAEFGPDVTRHDARKVIERRRELAQLNEERMHAHVALARQDQARVEHAVRGGFPEPARPPLG